MNTKESYKITVNGVPYDVIVEGEFAAQPTLPRFEQVQETNSRLAPWVTAVRVAHLPAR